MTQSDKENGENGRKLSNLWLYSLIVVVGVVAGLAFVFLSGEQAEDNQASLACKASGQISKVVEPMASGSIASLQIAPRPGAMADLAFFDAQGVKKTIADFKGKAVLLNLWATWCAPCRKEMPDLDELQASLGGEQFEVVAVSIDRGAPDVAQTFLDKIETKHLALYHDSSMEIFQQLKRRGLAFGMPTTLVLDKQGCAIGYMAGPAAWASEEAQTLLKIVMAAKSDSEAN